MNFLRLGFLIHDFKLAIDSQFTKECGREFQGVTIRTEKKCCLHYTLYFAGYEVLGYDL